MFQNQSSAEDPNSLKNFACKQEENELTQKSTALFMNTNRGINDDLQEYPMSHLNDVIEPIELLDSKLKENEYKDGLQNMKNEDSMSIKEDDTKSKQDTNSPKQISKEVSSLNAGNNSEEETKEVIRNKIANLIQHNKDIDLAQRRDVVNKTVLRVLRRYYAQLFKEMFPKKFKSKEAKSKWYFEYIKNFCIHTFGENHECLEQLQFYMASIINPGHMTKENISDAGMSQSDLDVFHN